MPEPIAIAVPAAAGPDVARKRSKAGEKWVAHFWHKLAQLAPLSRFSSPFELSVVPPTDDVLVGACSVTM